MRIEGLELKNIGVFEDVKMEFPKCPDGQAEIHIFTGVNGSGKSTILKALACGFERKVDSERDGVFLSEDLNNFYHFFRLNNEKDVAWVKTLVSEGDGIGGQGYHLTGILLSDENDIINKYRSTLNPELEWTLYEYEFAVFSYSGYSQIDNNPPYLLEIKNPLYQALKFLKQADTSHSLEEWVKKSLYKRAYARDNNLDKKETAYNDTIDKLEKAISEIVGFDIRFALDETLENPVVRYHNQTLSFDVIPDGLKSLVSWLADLCIRLDKIKWEEDTPVFNRNIILFLDEIENHLHIKWQRRVLPIVQKLLPNAQIFVTTHSPFVVNSIDDAWVHRLQLDEATKTATIAPPQSTSTGNSYITELMKTFEVYEEYGIPVSEKLQEFHKMKNHILEGKNGNTKEFLSLAKDLANVSPSLNNDIQIQLRKLSRQTSKEFSIYD